MFKGVLAHSLLNLCSLILMYLYIEGFQVDGKFLILSVHGSAADYISAIESVVWDLFEVQTGFSRTSLKGLVSLELCQVFESPFVNPVIEVLIIHL